MTYPDEWQPGEPWPTDEAFEAAGFVRFSGRVGGAVFTDCWMPEDGFFEDDEPVERVLAEYATGMPVVTVAPPTPQQRQQARRAWVPLATTVTGMFVGWAILFDISAVLASRAVAWWVIPLLCLAGVIGGGLVGGGIGLKLEENQRPSR